MDKGLRRNLVSQEFVMTARQLELTGPDLAYCIEMLKVGFIESGMCTKATFTEAEAMVAKFAAEVVAENPELFKTARKSSPRPEAN